jgi:hypothetical protein
MSEESERTAVDVPEVERSEASVLVLVLTEGVVGAAGGFVATAVTVGFLVVASALGAFDLASFQTLVGFLGVEGLLPGNERTAGFAVFFAHGMFVWPLLFASLGRYLPGDRFALKGIPFGVVMWTGFLVAFYDGYAGLALAGYVALSLLAHLGYGFTLGAVFDYYVGRDGTLTMRPQV